MTQVARSRALKWSFSSPRFCASFYLDVAREGDVQDELRVVVAPQRLPLALQPLFPVQTTREGRGFGKQRVTRGTWLSA